MVHLPSIARWILPWLAVLAYACLTHVLPLAAPVSIFAGLPVIWGDVGFLGSTLVSLLPAVIVLGWATNLLPWAGWLLYGAIALCGIVAALLGVVEIAFLACAAVMAVRGIFAPYQPPFGAFPADEHPGARRLGRGSFGYTMIDLLDDGLMSINREGMIIKANAAARRLVGTNCEGLPITRFLPILREPEFADFTALDRRRMDTHIQRESSESTPVEFTLTGRGFEDDWVGVIRVSDNTDRAERLAKLERLALHDSLTGLPNRVLLNDRIEQSLNIAERRGEPLAIMLMDLNKFKQVNDTLGHHVGDLLLQAVGPRLTEPLRDTDTLARLGGDEFAVLLPPATSERFARDVAERLVEAVADPFLIEGMRLELGVSIGVAMFPEHGGDAETLLQNADMAMYKAKREKLGFCVFDSKGDQAVTRRVQLQRDLRTAVDNGDLEVLFQPKVATSTWEVTGFEALVRWQHPALGVLPPQGFIPLAEQTGLIMPLTLAVINACLRAQRQWRQAGLDFSVAVNISPKWMQDKEFPKILRLLLESWNGRADRLILELPEAAIMTNPVETTAIMRGLRDQGVELSLDDFGTGYSSLPLLQKLPIQELKIDQRFIGEMIKDQNAAIVVRAVIKLAHALALRVVAEGVESQTTAEWLGSLGGDELQGYFFGKPMVPEAVPTWIGENAHHRPLLARVQGGNGHLAGSGLRV